MSEAINKNMDRNKYIGGSDVAGILGISPWKTRLDVYLDKTVGRETVTPEKEKLFRRGTRMEPYIIDLLAEEEGLNIMARGNRYIDPEYGFLAAEIDAETATENIEIKTVSPFKAKEWGEQQTDEVPVHYTAQIMHGLMVTGRNLCVMGVLIGGDDFRVYRVERDDEIITSIRKKELEFWERIQTLNPPDITTVRDVTRLYGTKDAGTSVEVNDEIETSWLAMKSLNEQIKPLEKLLEQHKEKIQMYMKDAANLTLRGATLATWKQQSSNRFDQSAFKAAQPELFEQFKTVSESRVFRIK